MRSETNIERRRLLVRAVATTGFVGFASAATPFVRSWLPSERAKALGGPIEIDIRALEPGAMTTALWQGKLVYVVRRSPKVLAGLADAESRLVDPTTAQSEQPSYARNRERARNPEYLVVLGICTHLACAPAGAMSGSSPRPEITPTWSGGFYCACHGSLYDASGRVYHGVPAPANLRVPPYYFQTSTRIVVGLDAPVPS